MLLLFHALNTKFFNESLWTERSIGTIIQKRVSFHDLAETWWLDFKRQ